jgi:hypothetical protein
VIEPLSPEVLAWLRQSAAVGVVTSQALLHLLERVEAMEARPIPGAVELAADLSTLDAKAWAYIGKQSICGDPAATALIDLLSEPPPPQPAPEAAPEAAPVATPMPDGYAYGYPGVLGGIEFSGGREINESRPIKAIPCWLGRPPASEPAPPVMQRLMEAPMDARGYVDLREPPAAQPAPPPAPAGGLVERVADAIGNADYDDLPPVDLNRIDARAAIREVAKWLRSDYSGREGCGTSWANLIEEEANR